MIDPKTLELATDFAAFWSTVFEQYPAYRLDFSWPSVATVDRLLFILRRKKHLTEQDLAQITGAAAYLAKIAHDCWRSFPDNLKVEVNFIDNPEEIVIKASGGNFLAEDSSYRIGVLSALKRTLANTANTSPGYANYQHPAFDNYNIVSPFAIGLLSGLSPWGEGGWNLKEEADLTPYLKATADFLASITAAHLAQVFPLDPSLGNSELFGPALFFPPFIAREEFPAARAAWELLSRFKQLSVDETNILRSCLHLANCQDPLIGAAAFAIAASLTKGGIDNRLRAQAEDLGLKAILLRPAVMLVRKQLGQQSSWLDLLPTKEDPSLNSSIFEMYLLEQSLGLIPCSILDKDQLANADLIRFFSAISLSRPLEARAILQEYLIEHEPQDQLILQLVYLDILLKDLTSAVEGLKQVNLNTLSSTENFIYCYLQSEICQATEAPEEAAGYQRKALGYHSPSDFLEIKTTTSLCAYLLSKNRYHDALDLIKASNTAYSLAKHLSAVICLFLIGENETAQEQLGNLFRIAPANNRVFSLIKDQALIKLNKKIQEEEAQDEQE